VDEIHLTGAVGLVKWALNQQRAAMPSPRDHRLMTAAFEIQTQAANPRHALVQTRMARAQMAQASND
jgi:hypothetical protein